MNKANDVEKFTFAYQKALAGNWKGGPASVTSHLRRRKKRGHLPESASELDLIAKGVEILKTADSIVYSYSPFKTIYFVVYHVWAVIFDEDGLWDTAFPPDVPERYFASEKGYKFLGKLTELIEL
jgi:hypothetical protein